MRNIFLLTALFIYSSLVFAPSVHAAENKKITLSGLQQKVEQLKKELQEQSSLAEKIRELEEKSSQANQTKKFPPYSYP
jgi:hypothetical protein